MRASAWPVVVALGLGACAGAPAPLTSSLPAAGTAVPEGAPARPLAPALAGPELDAVQAQLEDLDGPVPVRVVREDGALRLSLDAEASFAPGGGELLPAALSTYAGLAKALLPRGGVVVHVRVLGPAEADAATSLAARRAASLRVYLARGGVPATRLRAQGEAADRAAVEVLLRPVIAGREAQAWVPPT